MRVYSRKDFLKLPPGTMYFKGVEWAFESLEVKADSLIHSSDGDGDWVCLGLNSIEGRDSGEVSGRMDESFLTGASFAMNDAYGRDGCFDRDAVFLVMEYDDLVKLREMALDAINAGYAHSLKALAKPSD